MSYHATHLIHNAKAMISMTSTVVGRISAVLSVPRSRTRTAGEDDAHYGSNFEVLLDTIDQA